MASIEAKDLYWSRGIKRYEICLPFLLFDLLFRYEIVPTHKTAIFTGIVSSRMVRGGGLVLSLRIGRLTTWAMDCKKGGR